MSYGVKSCNDTSSGPHVSCHVCTLHDLTPSIDKTLLLEGRPTEVLETHNPVQILRELLEMLGEPIEVEE